MATIKVVCMVLIVFSAFLVGYQRGQRDAYDKVRTTILEMEWKRGKIKPPTLKIDELRLRFTYVGCMGTSREFYIKDLGEDNDG